MLIGAFVAVGVAAAGVAFGAWFAHGAHLDRVRARIAEQNARGHVVALLAARDRLVEAQAELDQAIAERAAACEYVRNLDRGQEVRVVSAVHLGWLRGQAHSEALAQAFRLQCRALEMIVDGAVAPDRIARDALEDGRRIVNGACEAQKETS